MGQIYVVGIGPGAYEEMTIRGANVLSQCDVIAGYTVYVELVRKHFPEKEFIVTPMRREEERCELAFKEAEKGRRVALICSGDAGIYGMAGLMYEIGRKYKDISIEVVPGVTAALGGGALLGAPLVHDCCFISLSDLLTPWEKIEKRITAAAQGDFVICLYNPSSKKREDYLSRACDILLKCKKEDTVCGLAKNIAREGEISEILTLRELRDKEADMFTTVFIGNEETLVIQGKMVTPRGYGRERNRI